MSFRAIIVAAANRFENLAATTRLPIVLAYTLGEAAAVAIAATALAIGRDACRALVAAFEAVRTGALPISVWIADLRTHHTVARALIADVSREAVA